MERDVNRMAFAATAFESADAAVLRQDRETSAVRQVEAAANDDLISSGRGALAHRVGLGEVHNTMSEQAAAIRIQAHVRGRQGRLRAKALKASMEQLYHNDEDELDEIIGGQ